MLLIQTNKTLVFNCLMHKITVQKWIYQDLTLQTLVVQKSFINGNLPYLVAENGTINYKYIKNTETDELMTECLSLSVLSAVSVSSALLSAAVCVSLCVLRQLSPLSVCMCVCPRVPACVSVCVDEGDSLLSIYILYIWIPD